MTSAFGFRLSAFGLIGIAAIASAACWKAGGSGSGPHTAASNTRDDAASHASFKQHHRLPFTLLSDPRGKVAEAWGVSGGLIPGRVTFVFDKTGVCRHRFSSAIRFGKHVDEALAVVKTLA